MKVTNTVYQIVEVAQACERAERRHNESGEHWAVFVDENCPSRTWTTPSDEPISSGVIVFDTADGGKLL